MTVLLLNGDDPVLVGEAVRSTVADLVGSGDAGLMVEELDEERFRVEDGFRIDALVDAAQTPPFLTDRRVVVGRHLARFGKADDVAPLVAYLGAPLSTTDLVLVWERGQAPRQDRRSAPPKSLVAALKEAGGRVVDVDVPSGRGAGQWLDDRLASAPVSFTPAARRRIAEVLGEDRSRVVGLVDVLTSTFGPGATVDVGDVTPYLGEHGGVPPWELTDAIDRGDIPGALDALHRTLGSGDRHPLQVMASLHAHYGRMLRLDGAGAADEKEAARILGMKGSTFPAKKALAQTRRLGSVAIAEAIHLLAAADLDLKGASGLPAETIVEVLVARLARVRGR